MNEEERERLFSYLLRISRILETLKNEQRTLLKRIEEIERQLRP